MMYIFQTEVSLRMHCYSGKHLFSLTSIFLMYVEALNQISFLIAKLGVASINCFSLNKTLFYSHIFMQIIAHLVPDNGNEKIFVPKN